MDNQIFSLLSEKGSLTERFRQMMGTAPRLSRINQGYQFVDRNERAKLSIKPREMALVREITMGQGETDWMFARTIVPLATLKGSARRIACLNETSIGKILFGRQGATRESMQVSIATELPDTLIQMGYSERCSLWQRESIFCFASGPLLITEIFLPDCPIYQAQYSGI